MQARRLEIDDDPILFCFFKCGALSQPSLVFVEPEGWLLRLGRAANECRALRLGRKRNSAHALSRLDLLPIPAERERDAKCLAYLSKSVIGQTILLCKLG